MNFLNRLTVLLSGLAAGRKADAAARGVIDALENDAIAQPGGLSERRLLQLFIEGELPLIPANPPHPTSRDIACRATPSGRFVFRAISASPGCYGIDISTQGRSLSLSAETRRQLALAGAWLAYDLAQTPMTPELSAFMSERKARHDARLGASAQDPTPFKSRDRSISSNPLER